METNSRTNDSPRHRPLKVYRVVFYWSRPRSSWCWRWQNPFQKNESKNVAFHLWHTLAFNFLVGILPFLTLRTLKGKLGDFFLLAQSFYRPQTKTSFKRQLSQKSPKVGQKSGQRVQNSQNKDQMASDLLWESINSVHRPTVGIHQFCPRSYCGNPLFTNLATNLLWESINSVLRAAVGIHQFCPPSYCGNPLYIQHTLSSRILQCQILLWFLFGQISRGENINRHKIPFSFQVLLNPM